jgi:hypothetical protein
VLNSARFASAILSRFTRERDRASTSRLLAGAVVLLISPACQLVGYGTRSPEAGAVGLDSGGPPPLTDGAMDAAPPLSPAEGGPLDGGPLEGGQKDSEAGLPADGSRPDASNKDARVEMGDAAPADGGTDETDASLLPDAAADSGPPQLPACPASGGDGDDEPCKSKCQPGAPCNLLCGTEQSCELDCEAGATCTFSCRNTEDCNIRCRAGSTCNISCLGSDCSAVRCDPGAVCKLTCGLTESCDFETCEDAIHRHCTLGPVLCGAGLICPLVVL